MKQEVSTFLARLRKAGRTYPARSVDNTAHFPSAAIRRLQMGLPARPRGDDIELPNLSA
jgi:hypothetical protein